MTPAMPTPSTTPSATPSARERARGAYRRLGLTSGVAAVLVGGHAFLLDWMVEHQVAAQLLSASADTDPGALVAALAFLALRLAVYFVVPGLVIYACLRFVWRLRRAREHSG